MTEIFLQLPCGQYFHHFSLIIGRMSVVENVIELCELLLAFVLPWRKHGDKSEKRPRWCFLTKPPSGLLLSTSLGFVSGMFYDGAYDYF